jgi:cytochrome P450 family 4
MMDTLLQAQMDGLIDDEGIIEETDTFTFEGHDTTSSAMTFTLLLLAHHPEAQEGIFQEIHEVTNERDEITMDDLNKMNYMERVLKESMRLYPPVPFISRSFNEDVQISKY